MVKSTSKLTESTAIFFGCETVGSVYFPFTLQGKVKQVTERNTATAGDLLEPTPNFDCHVSRSLQNLQANSPLNQVFDYSQVGLKDIICVVGFVYVW